ncbi:flavin-containing monooxygenase [Fretibacter rubidus]|uniref:flavin-containing monooxygenase n=1 Tax=Fretibacter rubidus TaxID=570162 RepID=UPI00352AD2D3
MSQSAPIQTPIIIIGTGFGGIAMAVTLQKAGFDNFIMLEKASTLGGTWRDNTYPGAECDIPSALYSYSFAPNPTWDFKWAKQPQILAYINKVARDYGLVSHMRFEQGVVDARYDNGRWAVTTTDGTSYDCQFLVSAVGQLHHPALPNIPGIDDFAGSSFHSAQWDHTVDLAGQDIGVIGNAASAVQFIPEIAKTAGHVTIYQRSANWVIDKGDRPYTKLEKAVAGRLPWLAKLYRFGLWGLGEYVVWPVIKGAKMRAAILRAKNRWDMGKHIKDPAMRAALTPSYPMGAKRILFSDKYYETLARDNVTLVTAPIKAVTSKGIKAGGDTTRDHDVIIYGTGFHTNPFLKGIAVMGEGGVALHEVWADGARAYMGTMMAGFPNLFTLYGPNTNTGHTSIIFKLEAQAGYVVQLMKAAVEGQVSVRASAADAFDTQTQERLAKLAWDKVDSSWYKDGTRLTNNWPGSSREFKRRTDKPVWADFMIVPKTQ